MFLRKVKASVAFLFYFFLILGNCFGKSHASFAAYVLLPFDVVEHKDFSQRVGDLLRHFGIGVAIANCDQTGFFNWFDDFVSDDRVFVGFESFQFFGGKLFLLQLAFAYRLRFRILPLRWTGG